MREQLPTDRPLRILVGAVEIGGQLTDFADAFRRLGHQVTTVIKQRRHRYFSRHSYDVDISVSAPDIIPWPRLIAENQSVLVRLPRGAANRAATFARVLSLIPQHDIFFFHRAGISLTIKNREYSFLKALGKRIVSVCLGGDVRYMPADRQQYDSLTYNDEIIEQELAKLDHPLEPLRNLRRAELYADLVLSVPNQAALAVRPYMHIYVLVNLDDYMFRVPARNVPVVVHAPSLTGVKGTATIVETLDRLRAEGVPSELRLLHGVQNTDVISALTDADVLIDQLYLPLHGKLTVEGMASGCAVATCNREDYEPVPPNRPICHIDRASIYDNLKRLLSNRELRVTLAHQGRQYVEKYHSHVAVTSRIVQLIQAQTLEKYDHYPTFYARHFRMPQGVCIPESLKRMTTRVVRRWGLPDDVDPQDMVTRGLLSNSALKVGGLIPRWEPHAQVDQSVSLL